MYSVNGQYGQQAPAPATGDNLHTAGVLLGVGMVIWSVVQVVFFFQSSNQLTSGYKAFGTVVVLLNVLMWMVILIAVATKKDNALLGKLCAVGVFIGLLTFIYDMQLIGWIMNFRILIAYSNSLVLFLSMTIILLMKNRATACNMWFIPGIVCSLTYLLGIQTIFNFGFTSLRSFLSYVLFPSVTIAFSFVFMKWAVKRDQIPLMAPANFGQFNPAPGYMPYPAQPMPQGYPPMYPAQPQPQGYPPMTQGYPPTQPAPIQPAAPVQPVSSQTDSVACPVCGNILRVADKFCSSCGTPNSMPTCSGCGAALRPNDKFCCRCGKPV